jgi:hypothetical protein
MLPLLGALLANTPLDGLFAQVRFPLEVSLAVLLTVHSIVVIAKWAFKGRTARPEAGPSGVEAAETAAR